MVIIMIKSELKTVYLPFPEKDDRKILIYVPEHNEGEMLPVIYMMDGQNLFDTNATPHGSWEVITAVENEMKQSGKSAVIVGIDNGNEYRDSELTPKCIGEVQLRHLLNDTFIPQGEIFDDFLMNTVIPYVEENFPVKTDRKNVAVCGSSSGGLMSFFAGIEHPDKFGFVGAFSPAFLCYTETDWRAYLMQKIGVDMPYLYIYTGNGDELEEMIFESVEMMYDLLPETGYPYDMMNEVILFENEHNEKAWRGIFTDFLHTFLNKQ